MDVVMITLGLAFLFVAAVAALQRAPRRRDRDTWLGMDVGVGLLAMRVWAFVKGRA